MPCANRSRNSGPEAANRRLRASPSPEFDAVREFLASGAAWPAEAPPDCIETSASLIFLTKTRAWKIKKPVRLPFIDLTTAERRTWSLGEELRLNRCLAGGVYRGLVPMVRPSDGGLALGGEGEPLEWVLEMERLPEAQMLDRRLRDGPRPRRSEVAALALVLIGFYRRAGLAAVDGRAYHARLLREAAINAAHLEELAPRAGVALDSALLKRSRAMLVAARSEILARARAGRIVDGHGDLRPEHVCLTDPPVIFDRLEFDAGLRLADPHDEAQYLGLECARAGAGWVGPFLGARLTAAGFPPPGPALMTALATYRCLTRARLALDHLQSPGARPPDRWRLQTRDYLALAARIAADDPGAGHVRA